MSPASTADDFLYAHGCTCKPRTIIRRGFYVGCPDCGACYRADSKGNVDANPPVAGTGAQCHYCGKRPEVLTRDHIVPSSRGGPNRKSNIVMACERCNRRKGDLRAICGCAQCREAWLNWGPGDLPATWSPK